MPRFEFTRKQRLEIWQRANGLLEYKWGTGTLRWRSDGREVTGFSTEGYRRVKIDGKQYQAHRIAWLLHYGDWPSDMIDHFNGDKSDNRIENLRVVNASENGRNRRRGTNSRSGVIGVGWAPRHKAWRAYIKTPTVNVHLGYFKSFDDAITARKAAERAHGYSPFHGRAR